jgi:hypothetical protein
MSDGGEPGRETFSGDKKLCEPWLSDQSQLPQVAIGPSSTTHRLPVGANGLFSVGKVAVHLLHEFPHQGGSSDGIIAFLELEFMRVI